MRSTKLLVLLLMAIAALSVAVACGSGDDEKDEPTATSAPVATATQQPAAEPTATEKPVADEPADDHGTHVKIGLLSPQTGPIAVYAPGFEDAADVAIAQLNASQDEYEFELVVVDSGCDGTQAATSAQSLIDAGVVAIVGAACSGATLGAIAVAAPAGIPMVSYASTSPAVTNADDDDHLFRVVPSDAQQAVALSLVVGESGASEPAVLYMTNDYGAGLADNFAENWSASMCTQVGYDPTEGSYDASTLAQAVVDSGCDSVVLMSYATDGAAIMEELMAQGFSGSTFGADGLADAAFEDSFTDVAALGGLVATKPRPGGASTAKADFESAYASAGGDPEGIYTHETFDAVNIIAA
ncbi:MAG: ABC transporter substrate-binding protein, partial [Dehalococcoidia bacterium]|nr:ABC transporter substrate-binding protein [Dehalococcoidia bacterium]